MRRQIKKTKPLSVVQAKKEADRFHNLAVSAQARLDEIARQETELRKEISDIDKQRKKIFKEYLQDQKKADALKEDCKKIEQEKNALSDDLKKSQSKLDYKENRIEELGELINRELDRATRRGKEEVSKLERKKGELADEILSLDKSIEVKGKKIDDLVVAIEGHRKVMSLIKKDIGKLTSEKDSIFLELDKLDQNLLLARDKKEDITLLDFQIEERNSILKDKENLLQEVEDKITSKEKEYKGFEEKMDAKIVAFKKLEKGIEDRTRRLKILLDQKGIEKYLDSQGIK